MKRKFSLFLNVAMLALCVCAIAIGVYSAKTASLNVGGTVGFVAHNCKVELTGNIQACTSSEATERTTKNITETTIGETSETYALDLNKEFSGQASGGKMYFSDMFNDGKTVIVTLTLKNTSAFDITATANLPTITGEVTTVVKLGDNVINASTSVDLSINATITMEITITLNSTDNDLAADISITGTLFNFTKKTAAPASSSLVVGKSNVYWDSTSNADRCYVEMGTIDGTAEGTKIKWYIFAQSDSNGEMQAVTNENPVVTNADNTLKAGTYWFISEYVLDCDIANEEHGIPFDAGDSQIYKDSDIQTYLNNVSETATTTESFAKKYNLSADNNATYNYLMTNGGRELPEEKGVTNVKDTDYTLANQYFWLLSVTELTYLAGETVEVNGVYNTLIANDTSGTAYYWWLRSPDAYVATWAFFVTLGGGVGGDGVGRVLSGVRAAFQITIN